ncbi:MAG: ATP-dependent Clp protease ATP-binding subunit [Bacilli bacterium]|nr:ATP-dependent Clp protease ATP-binding subunit [Bacilli bacterium]
MFHNFEFEVASLLEQAENEREVLRHPYVGSEHLLLAILKNNSNLVQKLKNVGLTYSKFKSELIEIIGSASTYQDLILYTPLLKRIIEIAMEDAEENNNGKVTEEHLFLALLEEGEGIAIRIMMSMDIDLDDLYDSLNQKKNQKETRANLEIYKIGIILNDKVSLEESVVGREKELDMMIETLLRKKKNNPLLIGKAGVGKTALVEELVRRIKKGEVPEELLKKEIVLLEMGSLVAGTKYRGEFEERLTKLIREIIEQENIILFIDEIHAMVNAGGAEGAINASDILKPYLARGELKCIGATTTEEYYKFIEKDKALERRFEKITLQEPNKEETIEILKKVKKEYENHHHIKISNQNIEEIVTLANEYIYNRQNPDKSLELLDSVCAKIKAKQQRKNNQNKVSKLQKIVPEKEKMIREGKFEEALILKKEEQKLNHQVTKRISRVKMETKDILEMIEKKTGIPLKHSKEDFLVQLEGRLEENIIGQKKAINSIMKILKTKAIHQKRPLSFLLLGPTGVGKTETVKQIASIYGKAENMIRLDMSEYALETSIHKLIGTPGGYVGYDEPYIFQKIKENPYRVILVDELEKANAQIWNLFLQILDEGFITDANGEVIHFHKTLIFMTSNLEVKDKVGFIKNANSELEEILSKELLGRFDAIVPYQKVNEEMVKQYINKSPYATKLDQNKIIEEAEFEKYGLRNVSHILRRMEEELSVN